MSDELTERDTKERLLNAAGEIFADKGVQAASVREICQRADANIAAVHYHFGDKQQLYERAVERAQCAQVAELPLPEWGPEIAATERLRDFIRIMFTRMLAYNRPRWHVQLMLRELAQPTPAGHSMVESYVRPLTVKLREVLAQLLPPGFDELERWRIGFSIISQILFYYIHGPVIEHLLGSTARQQLTVDVLTDHVWRFSLAALGHAPPLVPNPAEPLELDPELYPEPETTAS